MRSSPVPSMNCRTIGIFGKCFGASSCPNRAATCACASSQAVTRCCGESEALPQTPPEKKLSPSPCEARALQSCRNGRSLRDSLCVPPHIGVARATGDDVDRGCDTIVCRGVLRCPRTGHALIWTRMRDLRERSFRTLPSRTAPVSRGSVRDGVCPRVTRSDTLGGPSPPVACQSNQSVERSTWAS